jgi:hypothetical protein
MSTEAPPTEVPASTVAEPAPPTTATSASANLVPAATATAAPAGKGVWPDLAEDHPLSQLLAKLPTLLTDAGHDEIYGVTLKPLPEASSAAKPDFHTLLILQKFLRANLNDVAKAEEQLLSTLKWRKEFDPAGAAAEAHKREKYDGLGLVTVLDTEDGGVGKQVVTWNIYGAVKDYELTFTPIPEFLRWRIGLMELSVSKLDLSNATTPIPDFDKGVDPYQGVQVHDYLGVSFLRMDPRAKAASKETIEILSANYPETLSRKLFVNVPLLMQWMFAAMRLIVSAQTTKKFGVLSYGKDVAAELPGVKKEAIPEEYGGSAGALATIGTELKLD